MNTELIISNNHLIVLITFGVEVPLPSVRPVQEILRNRGVDDVDESENEEMLER